MSDFTIGIYCRVSTDEQAQKGLSLKDQEQKGIALANKHGFNYEVYIDAGVSGKLAFNKRPQLKLLIDRITDGKIQAIFVADIHRLSRGDQMQSIILKSIFKENNVKLFEGDVEIDLDDVNQMLLTDMKFLLSAYEVASMSKRIKEKILTGIKLGHVNGGPIKTYGYEKGEDKIMIIKSDEAKVVKLIFEMSLKGMGTKVIANRLNDLKIPTKRSNSEKGYMKVRGKLKTEFVWRDSVVYRILTNPIYKGKRKFKGEYYDCPAIIEADVFQIVGEKLKSKKSYVDTRNKYTYLLKGLIYCSRCRGRMYGRKREDLSDNAYICTTQRYKGEFCGNRGISINYIEKVVIDNLLSLDKQVESFYDKLQKDGKYYASQSYDLEINKKRLNELYIGREKLLDIAQKGGVDPNLFRDRFNKLTKETEQVTELINNAKKNLGIFLQKEEVIKFIKSAIKEFKKNQDNDSKINFLRSFISTIYIRWDDESLTHWIAIKYKIDKLSQYILTKELTVNRTGTDISKKRKEKILLEELVITNSILPDITREITTVKFKK